MLLYKEYYESRKMSQWINVFALKPDDLSRIPGTHTVEEENQLFHVISGLHTRTLAPM